MKNLLAHLWHLCGAALIAVSVISCEPEEVSVSSVSVSPASAELKTGQTIQLTATVLPDNAANKRVSWTTSDASIANVDQSGKVSALHAGKAVITASTKDGGKTAECAVTVIKASREDVFTVTKYSAGPVINGVKMSYSGTLFDRIYMLLPRPVSNQYQDITNFKAEGCTEAVCPDGVNHYIWRDITSRADVPPSGDWVISEAFDATVYKVVVDCSMITDYPEYDPESEECQKYLGKEENGLIDPTHSKIVSTANTLWTISNGDIITYARRCHEWTYENMTYGNMNTGLHTIANLMATMKGDCGNFSSVFISLLRAKGIPARHIVMVDAKKDEFHVRAEFYVPDYGWIPADPTWGDQYFGVFEGDFIVVTQGINTILRWADGSDAQADLFQTFWGGYWYTDAGSFIEFTHSCRRQQ